MRLVAERIHDAEATAMRDHLRGRHPELRVTAKAALGQLLDHYRVIADTAEANALTPTSAPRYGSAAWHSPTRASALPTDPRRTRQARPLDAEELVERPAMIGVPLLPERRH